MPKSSAMVEKIKGNSLVLFDNVQFIYELALAHLELKAFGAKFELSPQQTILKMIFMHLKRLAMTLKS